jgi:hypothetical protein
LAADKDIRAELGGRISLRANVQYRGNGPVKDMSYKDAYALQTKSRAEARASLLGNAARKSTDVPDGSRFLSNGHKKPSSSENPSAKDPHRSRRNNLASSQIKPPLVIDVDVASPPAQVAAPTAFATATGAVATDPIDAAHARLRKRAAKDLKDHKKGSKLMTPSTHAKTRYIHTGLTSSQTNPYIKSVVADELDGNMNFPSSQDVLQGIRDTIETPNKSG